VRVLIFGVDCAIGSALADALDARGHEIVGTTRRPRSPGRGSRLTLDFSDPISWAMPMPRVDLAVICAAMSRFADCRERPELARRVNVEAPCALARSLIEAGSRVVLLSTSAVFDGETPHAPADQRTAPKSAYGTLKAEAEAGILALGEGAIVLRLTKVLAPDMPLFSGWIATLRRGEAVRAFDDLTLSPISLADVTAGVLAIMSDRKLPPSIYQLSGAEDISYAEAAHHLATRLGVDRKLVETAHAVDNSHPAGEVSRFTSLDASRISSLASWRAPGATEVIDVVFAERIGAPRAGSLDPQFGSRAVTG
jgi:dTDP-4-dehydrorhamnose reductase